MIQLAKKVFLTVKTVQNSERKLKWTIIKEMLWVDCEKENGSKT